MPSVSFKVRYRKNNGLVFSADELKNLYFLGIPITDANGNPMSDTDIEFHIRTAQEGIENLLSLKFQRQVYEENMDWDYDQWKAWGFIHTTYMVRKALRLQGFFNTTQQIDYPEEWLSAKKANDGIKYHRTMNLVPIHGSANSLSNNVTYVGIAPHLGYLGNKTIPNYWVARYITGWERVPNDILDVVGKLAAINIFHQLGDLIVGAGIASKSISVDGLSQSISTTSSATNAGYGARIIGYLKDLERMIPQLSLYYKHITIGVV
jgi:hypothetical protein